MNPRRESSGRTLSPVVSVLLFMGTVIAVAVLYRSFQDYDDAVQPAAVISMAKQSPVADVTTDQIADAYQVNEIAADQQYQGKVIIVRGALSDIGRDDAGNPFVRLASATAPGSSPVICTFTADATPALARMRTGQMVAVKGLCIGRPQRVYIYLQDCIFR